MHYPPLRHRAPITTRPLTVALAVTALVAMLTACNDDGDSDAGDTTTTTTTTADSSATSTTTASTTASVPELSAEQESEFATELEFARCIRDNGVDGHPDPQINENGVMVVGVPWAREAVTWREAQQACQHIIDEAAPPEATGGAAGWEMVVPGGDCECADGSEFAFFERRADPTKVVFFLDGGGNCSDAASCAFVAESYDWKVNDNPAEEGGMFDFARADNPFGDHSFIYVPLCTGDVHLGDVTREYAPELIVEHNGYVNGAAALSYLAERYPDATQVVVVGKSGGSIAAPVFGGLAADLLPDAQVIVWGGQSGAIPDDPDLNAEFGELWGFYGNMPDWQVNEGLTAREWGPRRFWIQAGLHDPEIVLARFDYAYDAEVAEEAASLGLDPSELLSVIDANEAAIEEAGVVLHSYTAPGDEHGLFEWPAFYELEVNGVRLVDWVDALLSGQPPDDVHCTECEPS